MIGSVWRAKCQLHSIGHYSIFQAFFKEKFQRRWGK